MVFIFVFIVIRFYWIISYNLCCFLLAIKENGLKIMNGTFVSIRRQSKYKKRFVIFFLPLWIASLGFIFRFKTIRFSTLSELQLDDRKCSSRESSPTRLRSRSPSPLAAQRSPKPNTTSPPKEISLQVPHHRSLSPAKSAPQKVSVLSHSVLKPQEERRPRSSTLDPKTMQSYFRNFIKADWWVSMSPHNRFDLSF